MKVRCGTTVCEGGFRAIESVDRERLERKGSEPGWRRAGRTLGRWLSGRPTLGWGARAIGVHGSGRDVADRFDGIAAFGSSDGRAGKQRRGTVWDREAEMRIGLED